MKKWIGIVMTAALCAMLLIACGSSNEVSDSTSDKNQTGTSDAKDSEQENQNTKTESEIQPETAQADDSQQETPDNTNGQQGKVLVVYYSASGNTKAVAETIAQHTGGDAFEIVPVEAYSDEDLDWTQEGSRVNREHENESLQDIALVSTTVENFDSYNTIFIGYPIWWQEAAWVVNNFVKDNDFTGKTVIPFCTSSSSGLGESGTHLAQMAGTGDWQEGMRFRGSASESDVTEWLNGLGF